MSFIAPPAVPQARRSPVPAAPEPPLDLRALAGEVVRDMIRRDPALWACLQTDPDLLREFGFDPPSMERGAGNEHLG